MNVIGLEIPSDWLSEREFKYLKVHASSPLDLRKVWRLMDIEWSRCNVAHDENYTDVINKFYQSPVWLLNGIFTEADPESARHRCSIAHWVAEQNPKLVADFGGGYGSLARKIAAYTPEAHVEIVEPHPTQVAKNLAADFENVRFVSELPHNADIVIAQDVLEHVSDPLEVFSNLLGATDEGGIIITANCFYPVIKCHLQSTFHFRYTFRFIAPLLGCKFIGCVPGVAHAQIYRKNGPGKNVARVRKWESASRALFPVIEALALAVRRLRKIGSELKN